MKSLDGLIRKMCDPICDEDVGFIKGVLFGLGFAFIMSLVDLLREHLHRLH